MLACFLVPGVQAIIRDGGIDPSNLGKGDWIYQMNRAVAQCNRYVASVNDMPSLMRYLKSQGLSYVIVKAGAGTELFSTPGFSPQFTRNLVNSAHAAGLWIFGYSRAYATNTAGEVRIANYVFQQGADGFVWDAETEWESVCLGKRGPRLAIAQCSKVRANWPNRFLAYSTFAYVNGHPSFPYEEFGFYCDAAFPQAYWLQFGQSPSEVVRQMSKQWRTWHAGLSGPWVHSIKPLVPVAQGYSGHGVLTGGQISQFVTALKSDPAPACVGGYNGVNYWACEYHTPEVWSAIRTNNIGGEATNEPPVGSR
jgi:hypothetical protein